MPVRIAEMSISQPEIRPSRILLLHHPGPNLEKVNCQKLTVSDRTRARFDSKR